MATIESTGTRRELKEKNRKKVKSLGGEKKKKMKTKIVTLLEIAIVICSVFLVAIPGIAADQTTQKVSASEVTTTSEDDYVLGIYGNANEDDTIDMRDLTYVKLIFFGKKSETELADAKYDGKINPLDFIQIKLIIVGKEKELTVVDSADKIVTLNKPIERIIADSTYFAEFVRTLKLQDKVVGVCVYVKDDEVFFPELSKLPSVGAFGMGHAEPDFEAIFELEPDILITYSTHTSELDEKLEEAGIPLVCFDLYTPKTIIEEAKKLGYIFNKRDEAEQYIDFYEDCMNQIKQRTKSISEVDKPRVYYECFYDYLTANESTNHGILITTAGGKNIASDLTGELFGWSGFVMVDKEWVMEQDPQVIIKSAYYEAGYDTDDPSGIIAAREAVLDRPELADVSAIKNERVYVSSTSVDGGSCHFVGTAYMAKWFHPALFADLDPQAMHQEYLTRFQGLDYDLDKHGVFVYPKEPVS
jgi:iron complex transport system substrate-binding protein